MALYCQDADQLARLVAEAPASEMAGAVQSHALPCRHPPSIQHLDHKRQLAYLPRTTFLLWCKEGLTSQAIAGSQGKTEPEAPVRVGLWSCYSAAMPTARLVRRFLIIGFASSQALHAEVLRLS